MARWPIKPGGGLNPQSTATVRVVLGVRGVCGGSSLSSLRSAWRWIQIIELDRQLRPTAKQASQIEKTMMIGDGTEDEEKWLAAGIAGLQQNAFYMHRALVTVPNFVPCNLKFPIPPPLMWNSGENPNFPGVETPLDFCFWIQCLSQDSNNLRDALKYSAQMLSELRTSKLSPHKYYALCEFPFLLCLRSGLFAVVSFRH